MKQTIRAFSIGLLFATILLSLTYYTLDNQTEVVEISTEEMITELEGAGYYVDLKPPSSAGKQVEQDQTTTAIDESVQEQETKEIEKPSSENITHLLVIESGMGLDSIIEELSSLQLIEDEGDFRTMLVENDYSTKIQIGEFELNYSMSEKEIADTITKQ
ncbi:hypothetical protein [Aquibacillus saliphilus]|uniref:hypothetical protein n=1 Tax=Aquibacillus saliphilus TaxID=1909422 RepID=UPI001CF070C8|nr:hypothetical protein [Aquibacillus saliphilus]